MKRPHFHYKMCKWNTSENGELKSEEVLHNYEFMSSGLSLVIRAFVDTSFITLSHAWFCLILIDGRLS